MTNLQDKIANSPWLKEHYGQIVVLKYGGNAMETPAAAMQFADDIALMVKHGVKPVVVHGGGPQIDQMLTRLNIHNEFVRGIRVTSAEAIEIIEMVLCGKVGPEIISALSQANVMATAVSGKDSNLIQCEKRTDYDYGFVGDIKKVNPEILHKFLDAGIVPVIAPIGIGTRGESYNINADIAAGAIAGALHAHRFLLLTNVAGVLDADKKLIAELTPKRAKEMIKDGIIAGGMIPKVETCLLAVESGSDGAVILDGRTPHAALVELFTNEGSGTLVRA